MRSRSPVIATLLAGFALAGAGCGDDDQQAPAGAKMPDISAIPTTTPAAGAEKIDARHRRKIERLMRAQNVPEFIAVTVKGVSVGVLTELEPSPETKDAYLKLCRPLTKLQWIRTGGVADTKGIVHAAVDDGKCRLFGLD